MDFIPYPPDWSREDSPETFAYWEKYSRHCWIRFCLLFRDDDHQAGWRLTAVAGGLAFMLVLLLFLETISSPTVQQPLVRPLMAKQQPLVVSTLTDIDPPFVEVSYEVEVEPAPETKPEPLDWPVVEARPVPKPAPEPLFDPFEQFAPPPEKEKTIEMSFEPPAEPVPPPVMVEEVPIVKLPELLVEANQTDLLPDKQYTEDIVTHVVESQFRGADRTRSTQNLVWNKSSGFRAEDFASPIKSGEMDLKDTPVAQAASALASSDQIGEESVPHAATFEGALVLTKQCPEEVNEQNPFTYTLTLKNEGKQAVPFVRVHEETAEVTYLKSEPKAHIQDRQLYWTLTDILPGEERVLQVTCLAKERDQILSLNSSVEVMHALSKATHVFVPDVTVSITLPVEVVTGKDFFVEFVVSNNSEKTFQPSKLRLQMLKGLHSGNKNDLTTFIDVPEPGKTFKFNLAMTPVELGEAMLQADLQLEKTLTVPVTAYTMVAEESKSEETPEKSAGELPLKKHSNRLAVNGY